LKDSVGAIFGSTLKSILEFSGVAPSKRATLQALRHLAQFLAPVGRGVGSIRGDDRVHLANGLASHHVITAQRLRLPESREPQHERSWLGRNGCKDVALGATAATLCAHYIMSMSGSDAQAVAQGLDRCSRRASELLDGWPVHEGAEDRQCDALHAEARALGRARAAAGAAAAMAASQNLSREAALQLQFDWMRRAAWPRGASCDGASHHALMSALNVGPVDDTEFSPVNRVAPLSTLPLGALPAAAWLDSGASDASSSDDSRSNSLASSASSLGSSVDDEEKPLTPEEAGIMCTMLGRL